MSDKRPNQPDLWKKQKGNLREGVRGKSEVEIRIKEERETEVQRSEFWENKKCKSLVLVERQEGILNLTGK